MIAFFLLGFQYWFIVILPLFFFTILKAFGLLNKIEMMFTRYKTEGGREVVVARIYSSGEHTVRNSQIDKDALWAIRKIQAQGAEAYIVGGAVRDMLLGRKPKDFDIATSLSPRQVQKLFWNARIIGRRFRIVHLYFNHDKIIEVTTFRSDEENFEEGNNNIYGTIEQDAKRRDFSINSLYYNPQNGQLLDFNNSMEDFKKRRIRSLIPLSYSFSEDPVRMIRAIKYHVTTGFSLKLDVKWAIRRNSENLSHVSTSRLTEEVGKILTSAHAKEIFTEMNNYKLLPYLLPCLSVYIEYPEIQVALKKMDEYVSLAKKNGDTLDRAVIFSLLLKPLVFLDHPDSMSQDERMKEVFREIKVFISPMTPPNYEIEKSAEIILESMGYKSKAKSKAAAASIQGKKPGKSMGRKNAASEELSKPRKPRKNKKKNKITLLIVEYPEGMETAASLAESHDL